ncbi:alpha/beta hydrolase [Rathayibacter sp. YIM 133350]|uniref:alpha/beta fold hydrolase n=1 Tax=Rathayibacter sp. YIM 133350 TaxID=3131992 RepID=UPI00307F4F69
MRIALIHGLGSQRRYMLDLFGPALPSRARVRAPDVRAHGSSPLVGNPSDFALESLALEAEHDLSDTAWHPASSLEELDGAADPEPLTLIGVSMGAAIALRIAIAGRVPVERVLFVRPSFTDVPLPANLVPFAVIGQLLDDLGATEGAARFRETGIYHDVRAVSALGASGLLAQFGYPLARERAMRLVEIPRNRAFSDLTELAGLAVPSAVIAAPRDPAHPLPVAEQWAGGLNAPLTVLPARDDGQAAQTAALRSTVAEWIAR